MSSAYRLHPESRYSSPPRLHHKLGLALAFIAFGSIAGAGGIVLHMAGTELDSSGSPVIAAAALKPSAAPPPPAVSAPKAPPSNPTQTTPVAAMIAAAPEPAPSAAPALVAAADAEPAVSAATEPPPPPVAAAKKPKSKTARSQSRRDRRGYDAYAWSPSATYGRRDYWRPAW